MADNDVEYIKALKTSLRRLKFNMDFYGKSIMDAREGNEYIYQRLISDEPCMIARFGSVELRCVTRWMKKRKFTDYNRISINEAAGVFPNDDETISRFCETYTSAAMQSDALIVWAAGMGQRRAVDVYTPNASLMNILSIEPFMFSNPWSRALKDKKVLIVHPFTDTIEAQLSKREKLFSNPDVLPEFKKVEFIKAVQSNAGQMCDYRDWFEALKHMESEIDKKDFEIAIVGAGAYGIPLAAYIKGKRKKVIHMAGVSQLLFGIKGKRWEERPEYADLINEFWVRPSLTETPEKKEKVEGGSYW